jgi:hypothetical protein
MASFVRFGVVAQDRVAHVPQPGGAPDWSDASARVKRRRPFLVALTLASINIATNAAAVAWRAQFLPVCQSGCTQQSRLSAEVCSQICNCTASDMEATFGAQSLGSGGAPSAEQQRRANEIQMQCIRRVLGR